MKKLNLIILALILFVTGCESVNEEEKYSTGIFAMNTYITIDLYGENSKIAAEKISKKINDLESKWSTTLNTSEIYKINNAKGKSVKVSNETKDIISYSLDIADKTDGALNPAIYPLVKEWGFTTGNYKIPTQDDINNYLKNVDFRNITLQKNDVRINENMELDLGAVGKGYTGDVVSEIAKNNGISCGLINLGGNVQAIGSKPDGSKWKLGLQNPFGDNNIGILKIADCVVVTSGNYEKYFIGEDGKRYCHIINPKSGYPVDNGLVSVTIVGKEGKKCDALSTALFVMGKEKAIEYWKENKDFELILITDDREIYITSDLKDSFSVTDESLVINTID
jgi:hypothetical protein